MAPDQNVSALAIRSLSVCSQASSTHSLIDQKFNCAVIVGNVPFGAVAAICFVPFSLQTAALPGPQEA